MRFVLLLLILALTGCTEERIPAAICPDGSVAATIAHCREPEQSSAGGEVIIEEKAAVDPSSDPKELFDRYIREAGLPYTFISSEIQKQEGDRTFYRIRYGHPEGKGYLVVDSTGLVYDEYYSA